MYGVDPDTLDLISIGVAIVLKRGCYGELSFVVAAIWSPKCKHSMLTADVYHYISTVQHAEGLAVGIDVYPFL
jgi:hypothetical protein